MVKDIKKQMEQFHMLEKGDRVLIGLSGGADSVCLARVLYELAEEYELTLAAVCCHHGLRGEEADRDVLFVEDFCKEHKIRFYKVFDYVEQRAFDKGMTLEEAGREFRYETFQSIMTLHGYNKLAIAHNADDRAETMLFHLIRGTGIAGLCTMEPVRVFFEEKQIIRPLLWTRKEAIENWLRKKNISWRTDETNLKDIYTRNRIRHHILPELSAVNDRAVEHMGEAALQFSEIHDYLKEEENRIYREVVSKKADEIVISVPRLNKSHSYMKKAVLYRSLSGIAKGSKDITSGHIKILLEILNGGTGKEAHLIKGIRARREYDSLILSKDLKIRDEMMEKKKEEILNHLEWNLEKIPYTGQEISKNEYTKHFDCAKILNELCLRFWQKGDYLYLKEDGGKKKLNRYFIDEKIPLEKRGQIPLLADGNHILWIVGHRISAYYKVTEQTKEILSVTIKNKG